MNVQMENRMKGPLRMGCQLNARGAWRVVSLPSVGDFAPGPPCASAPSAQEGHLPPSTQQGQANEFGWRGSTTPNTVVKRICALFGFSGPN